MNKILAVIKREFITRVMTKGFVIGTVLGPVFILGVMFLPSYFMMKETPKSVQVGVVNLQDDLLSALQNNLNDTISGGERRFKFIPVTNRFMDTDKNGAIMQLINESVFDIILVFPDNLVDSAYVDYYAKNINNFQVIKTVTGAIGDVVNQKRYLRAGLDLSVIENLKVKLDVRTVKVTKQGVKAKEAGIEYVSTLIMVMMIYFGLLFYGQYIWKGIVEDKVSRIVEVLLSSISSFQFMMGKLFGNGLIGLFQFGIWSILGVAGSVIFASAFPAMAANIPFTPVTFLYFMVFFVLGYFFYSTFYAMVGAISSTSDDAQQLQAPFTIAIVGAFMLTFLAINEPDSQLITVLSLIPFFTPFVMFTRILVSTPPGWEILASIVINALSILIMVKIAAKIFRIGILMYGKRPTLPEIIKWVGK